MATITQRIGWTNDTTANVAPASVRAQGTAFRLSGNGLTVNGKTTKTVSIPVSAEGDFRKAVASGARTVTITRTSRGRPSKAVSMATLATTLGKAPRAPRKPRQSAPTAPQTGDAAQ